MSKKIKSLLLFTFLFLLTYVSASANSQIQGTWYLIAVCENDKCLESYKSGLHQEIEISGTGDASAKGSLSAFKGVKISFDLSTGSNIVLVTRADGEKEEYQFSINDKGNLVLQSDPTMIVFSREKPFIPGMSEIALDVSEKDYYGTWKLVGMVSHYEGDNSEMLDSFAFAKEMKMSDTIEIRENNELDISIAGVKFEHAPYVIDNERLYSVIGVPGTENSIVVIMNIHTDGYLTVAYDYDVSMDLIFEKETTARN